MLHPNEYSQELRKINKAISKPILKNPKCIKSDDFVSIHNFKTISQEIIVKNVILQLNQKRCWNLLY